MTNGVLVQLVRIHACHAWGHGFESRTHRENLRAMQFYCIALCSYLPRHVRVGCILEVSV